LRVAGEGHVSRLARRQRRRRDHRHRPGLPLTALLIGALGESTSAVEAGTLAIEAFLVSEIYHISTKLLLGREAPLESNGVARSTARRSSTGPMVAVGSRGDPVFDRDRVLRIFREAVAVGAAVGIAGALSVCGAR